MSVRLAGYEGAPIDKLSPFYIETLYHQLLGGVCAVHPSTDEDENYIDIISIQGGNTLLPEKLAQSLNERVHLNMPLTAVSKALDHSYELTFQNGQKIKADILVLAIPCPVYQDILFEKDLIPEEKLSSIQNIQYGTNAKILIPCLQPHLKRTSLYNDRIGSYFDPISCTQLLYYTGEAGRFSADSILETYQKDRPLLEVGLGDLCPPFITPVFARDEPWVSYEGPVGYSWPNDPYVKGSYSYVASGQETLVTAMQQEAGEKVKTLFAPIDQTLYFAGEHTTILMEALGTMEAACESGERAARMIQKSLEVRK